MKRNPLSFQIDVDKFGSASESEKRSTNLMRPNSTFFADGVKRFAKNPVAMVSFCFIVILLIFVFIGIFVYIGGDHCVANMYYFSFANNWTGLAFLNIALATICNSLGTIPGVLLFKTRKK